MAGGTHVEIDGLSELLEGLSGPAFKDLNRTLRTYAQQIAQHTLLPEVQAAVARSQAPQAAAMARTARVHRDRLPVVVLGKVNPRFDSGFRLKGSKGGDRSPAASRRRRGALARGVVVGPAGGKRSTPAAENYYHIARDPSGGPLGAALRGNGRLLQEGRQAYLDAYMHALTLHGFDAQNRPR